MRSLDRLKTWGQRTYTWRGRETHGVYEDLRHTDALLEKDESQTTPSTGTSNSRKCLWILSLLTKAAFIASYIVLISCAWTHQQSNTCLLGNEGIFDDPPIVYETRRFQRAGFHDPRHNHLTKYEGFPNEDNNAEWDRLLAVGVVGISKGESSGLANGTATARKDATQYIVELEIFHQLHCLKWIRDVFWELVDESNATTTNIVDGPQWQDHTDHCIDFLRQTIMCHGDITPITFEWIGEISGYIAHHTTEHKCRDFDTIYEWARRRDTTGLRASGKHQNVEFSEAEKED